MADELTSPGGTLLTRPEGVWSLQAGDSAFLGTFVPQIGRRLIGALIFPGIPAGALLGILAVGNYHALAAALLICAGLCFVCGPVAACLRIFWSKEHSRIDGVTLRYTGSFVETAVFLTKIALLSLVTLGLYWLLGFSAASAHKYIYARTTRADNTHDLGRSGFVGNFLHILVPKIVITAIPTIILIMMRIIPNANYSQQFADYLVRNPNREPTMELWTLLKYIVNQGFSVLRVPAGMKDPNDYLFYNEVTTLIWTGILLFVAGLVLIPWYRYKMIKWEVDNAVIGGYRLTFGATLNEYYLHCFAKMFLFVITLGLYGLLGRSRISSWRFRAKHTHVYLPSSAQAKAESYMIPPEALNKPWRQYVRDIFNPDARRRAGNYTRRYWTLYLLLLLPIVYVVVFKYVPMLFIQIGVKENNIVVPTPEVAWAKDYGFEWFLSAFKNPDFTRALRNTMMLNGLDLLFGFPAPVILAILLNELTFRRYKRISQTIFYMPHFLSWVIIASLALQLFNPSSGLVNVMLENMKLNPVTPFNLPFQWVVMYVALGIWQSAGWGTIIYLAAITNINPELYEAAAVDGANRMRKIWHITLPGLRPTIIILLIMRMGSILGSDFERAFALRNNLITRVSDGLSIYIYQYGLQGTKFSLTAAVGIFQSVICLIFLFGANALAKRFGERGVW